MAKSLVKRIEESRFLVTGGLGFVGSAIVRRLLKKGAKEVVLFDLKSEFPPSFDPEGGKDRFRIFTGDIRDKETVHKALEGCDYVFHEAALRVTRCAKEPRLAHEILVDGTFNVVEACVKHRVKKLIHASSAIVYGTPLRLPLDEGHPTHDTTLYGISKVANENLLRSFKEQFGLDYVALRYFNIYGPGMNLFGSEVEVLVRWLDRLDSGLPPLIFGDGKQTLDWIFIEDVVEANWKAFLSEGSGSVFNVCTGRETSILELLGLLLQVRGSRLEPEFRESRTVNQVSRRFGSPEKAAKEMGFRSCVPLEKGLREFVEWRDKVLAERAQKGLQSQSR